MPNPESIIQSAILAAIGTMPGIACWRSSVGNGWVRTKNGFAPMRFGGRPGQPDIMGCYWGLFFGIEVKTKTGTQEPDQIDWQSAIEAAGGCYILARSVDDALEGLRRLALKLPTHLLQAPQSGAIQNLPVGAADTPPVRMGAAVTPLLPRPSDPSDKVPRK